VLPDDGGIRITGNVTSTVDGLNGRIDSTWDTSVWANGSAEGNYPTLLRFANSGLDRPVFSGYSSYTSAPTIRQGPLLETIPGLFWGSYDKDTDETDYIGVAFTLI